MYQLLKQKLNFYWLRCKVVPWDKHKIYYYEEIYDRVFSFICYTKAMIILQYHPYWKNNFFKNKIIVFEHWNGKNINVPFTLQFARMIKKGTQIVKKNASTPCDL